MQLTQALTAFERADTENRFVISMGDAIEALEELGFSLDATRVCDLLNEYAKLEENQKVEVGPALTRVAISRTTTKYERDGSRIVSW